MPWWPIFRAVRQVLRGFDLGGSDAKYSPFPNVECYGLCCRRPRTPHLGAPLPRSLCALEWLSSLNSSWNLDSFICVHQHISMLWFKIIKAFYITRVQKKKETILIIFKYTTRKPLWGLRESSCDSRGPQRGFFWANFLLFLVQEVLSGERINRNEQKKTWNFNYKLFLQYYIFRLKFS